MKSLRIIALLALLAAAPARAGDLAGTNQMPAPIHALMETAGYGVIQTNLPVSGPNLLKNLPPIEISRLRPLELPVQKSGWSLWNNTGIKYAGKSNAPVNVFAPGNFSLYSALSQFEYDVNCSFDF